MLDIKTIIYLLKGIWLMIDYINHKNKMKIYEGVITIEEILWVIGVLLLIVIVGIVNFIING